MNADSMTSAGGRIKYPVRLSEQLDIKARTASSEWEKIYVSEHSISDGKYDDFQVTGYKVPVI